MSHSTSSLEHDYARAERLHLVKGLNESNLTRSELSQKTGLSVEHIKELFAGTRTLHLPEHIALCLAIGLDIGLTFDPSDGLTPPVYKTRDDVLHQNVLPALDNTPASWVDVDAVIGDCFIFDPFLAGFIFAVSEREFWESIKRNTTKNQPA